MFASVETVVSVPVEGGALTLELAGTDVVITGPGMSAVMSVESLAAFVAGAGRVVAERFVPKRCPVPCLGQLNGRDCCYGRGLLAS